MAHNFINNSQKTEIAWDKIGEWAGQGRRLLPLSATVGSNAKEEHDLEKMEAFSLIVGYNQHTTQFE